MKSDVGDLVRRFEKLGLQRGREVTESTVAAFEKAQRIRLPEDYRAFLLAVGEGAAGPDYGLLTLEGALEERGKTIYDLADEFPAPESTRDHLDFSVGGILPIQYSGCSYFSGLITTGPCRGQVWSSVEDRPGWVPCSNASIRVKDDDYRGYYDAVLAPANAKYRLGFAAWYASWLEGEERARGGGVS